MTTQRDRIAEATTGTGTGTLVLAGAAIGYRTFSSALGAGGNTEVYYGIIQDLTGQWEVGLGTYLGPSNAIRRDLVLSSSNAGALTSFPVGNKMVYVTFPAESTLVLRGRRATDVPLTLTAVGELPPLKLSTPNPAVWFQDTSPAGNLVLAAASAAFAFGLGDTAGAKTADWMTLAAGGLKSFTNVFIETILPQLQIIETDQTDPAGRYRHYVSGDIYNFQRALTAAFATNLNIFSFTGSTSLLTIGSTAVTTSFAGPVTLTNADVELQSGSPQLRFAETDFAAPLGRFRMAGIGGILQVDRNTAVAGDFSTTVTIASFAPEGASAPNPHTILTVEKGDSLYLGRAAGAANPITGGELVIARAGNKIRLKEANTTAGIAVIEYADATAWQVLLTNTADADGTFNALRPLSIAKATGLLTSANGQLFHGGTGVSGLLTLSGGASITGGGLDFGSQTAATPQDLSKHIDLYGATYGLSVSSSALNAILPAAAQFFVRDTTGLTRAEIAAPGTAATNTYTVITQEKGDFRYLRLGTAGTITAPLRVGDIYIGADTNGNVNTNSVSSVTGLNLELRSGTDTGAVFFFYGSTGTEHARIEPAGTAITDAQAIVTLEKGDARYLNLTAGSTNVLTGELVITKSAHKIRLKEAAGTGGIAALLYVDTSNFHIMFTAANDADGTFNALRPLYISKTTGIVTMGVAAVIGSISVDVDDGYIERTIAGSLILAVQTGSVIAFQLGGAGSSNAARIDVIGTSVPTLQTVITAEKGDTRYATKSGGVVPIAQGGTAAPDTATARSNLGANNATNLTTGTLPAARLGVTASDKAWVLAHCADATPNTVGAYAILYHLSANTQIQWNVDYAAINLRSIGFRLGGASDADSVEPGTNTVSGTWKAMGSAGPFNSDQSGSLFLRVA